MVHWILWWSSCSETTCLLFLEGKSYWRQSQCIPNICATSRMNFQTCLSPLKPGGTLSSHGNTANYTREKAECLNFVFASKSCVLNPSFSGSTRPWHTQLLLDSVSFAPEKVEKFLWTLYSGSATRMDSISSHELKPALMLLPILSLPFSPKHLPSIICYLLGNKFTSLHDIKRCKSGYP